MIKLYADGAAMEGIIEAAKDPEITGFTTNPTLMRQAGVTDYAQFAQDVIKYLAVQRPDTCLSLEVFADTPDEIIRQARIISDWGDSAAYPVYVKIPVMYTNGESTKDIIKQLSDEGIKLNITAVFTVEQAQEVLENLNRKTPSIVSIFAGRIADAGEDPESIVSSILLQYSFYSDEDDKVEFLWASSREAYNYKHAEWSGCDIITMTPDLIKKVKGFGKDLTQFSRETCQMFYDDAVKSGFKL
jgi:transaldolase